MTPGSLLADRYQIVRPLGRSASAATYLAVDTTTGATVVAKFLSLGLVDEWKSVELFERESMVLKGLHHERIPAYVDSFRADAEGDPRFVLVRQYVEGSDLQELVERGWRGTERQVCQIGRQIVSVVSYIQDLRPPVIHRDINPRNLVMRPDGTVVLVDFGGVQDAIRLSERAASTTIGTPGYAPMEQFIGHATVRSDLYGVAATLTFLLTRRSPADLPSKNLKVDVGSVIEISSAGLLRVLSNWLEPDEAARTLSLAQADQLLAEGPSAPAVPTPPAVSEAPPFGSRISYSVNNGAHRYRIPSGPAERRGLHGRHRRTGRFGILWLGFVGLWTYSAIRMNAHLNFLFIAVPAFGVGVAIIRRYLASLFGAVDLQIDEQGLHYSKRFLFSSRRRTVPLADVGECRREGALYLDIGAKTLRLAEGLSDREQEWLRDSIGQSLLQARRRAGLPDSSRRS